MSDNLRDRVMKAAEKEFGYLSSGQSYLIGLLADVAEEADQFRVGYSDAKHLERKLAALRELVDER